MRNPTQHNLQQTAMTERRVTISSTHRKETSRLPRLLSSSSGVSFRIHCLLGLLGRGHVGPGPRKQAGLRRPSRDIAASTRTLRSFYDVSKILPAETPWKCLVKGGPSSRCPEGSWLDCGCVALAVAESLATPGCLPPGTSTRSRRFLGDHGKLSD